MCRGCRRWRPGIRGCCPIRSSSWLRSRFSRRRWRSTGASGAADGPRRHVRGWAARCARSRGSTRSRCCCGGCSRARTRSPSRSTGCSPRPSSPWAASSAPSEHLAQQVGDARGGVGADPHLLVADDVKETVERFADHVAVEVEGLEIEEPNALGPPEELLVLPADPDLGHRAVHDGGEGRGQRAGRLRLDRKSTRLNSSHRTISYAVFCLKKKM